MKPTNTNLAEFFNLSRQTIGNYKKSSPKIYQALKEFFIRYAD